MSEEMIVDPHPDDVLSMAIRQREAARAERHKYRATALELLGEFISTGHGHRVAVLDDEHYARLQARL